MFRSAVAVLFTSIALVGCNEAGTPAVDAAGEGGSTSQAVGSAPAAALTNAADANTQTGAGATGTSGSGTPTMMSAARAAGAPSEPVTGAAAPGAQAPGASAFAGAAATGADGASGDASARTAPAEPTFKLVTVPAGTSLNVTLSSAVGSDTSNIEDAVRGTIASAVVIDGVTAIPAGSEISGTVTDAKQSGRVKGRASVAFRFNQLEVRNETARIQTSSVSREAEASTGDDVKKGGIGAGVGAIIGGVAGGKKGAVLGAGVGGAGTVMATRGKEVHLAAGSRVRVTLRDALEVRVPLG